MNIHQSIVCASVAILVHASSLFAGKPESGSVVGWGSQVIVRSDQLTNLTAVAAGGGRTLVLKNDGSIVGWGSNGSGELNVPAPNNGFVAISAGINHSLGLKNDGSIVA